MSIIETLFATRFVLPALGVGLLAGGVCLVNGASGAAGSPGAFTCEIVTSAGVGTVDLEGVVHAPAATQGTYDFRVWKSGFAGSSDIRQGGAFSAAPGETVQLGIVSLGRDAGGWHAELTVTSGGIATRCADNSPGIL